MEIRAAILHLSSCSYTGACQEHSSTGKQILGFSWWAEEVVTKGSYASYVE